MKKKSILKISTDLGYFSKANKSIMFECALNVEWPDELIVVSSHTGREIKFHRDEIEAALNEFWDGELYEYIPYETVPNVRKIILCFGEHPAVTKDMFL